MFLPGLCSAAVTKEIIPRILFENPLRKEWTKTVAILCEASIAMLYGSQAKNKLAEIAGAKITDFVVNT